MHLLEKLAAVEHCGSDPLHPATLARHAEMVLAEAERTVESFGELDAPRRRQAFHDSVVEIRPVASSFRAA